MMEKERLNDRLIVLLLVGVLGINYPLLALFDKLILWFGLPVLYLDLFCFWFVFICLLAWALCGRSRPKPAAKAKSSHSGRTA